MFAGKVGTGFDTKLLLELRARLDAIEIAEVAVYEGGRAAAVRAHWVRPEMVVQVAFHRVDGARQAAPLAVAGICGATRTRGTSCGSRGDHLASGEGAVPGGRDHQGRARGVLRGDRAVHAAAHRADGRSRWSGITAASARRGSFRRTCRRASPSGWSASRSRRRAGRCTIPWRETRGRWCGWRTRTASRRTCGSRARRELYCPDICVFDLDPSVEDGDALRRAALGLRDLLAELGLQSWVKTSGSKGFHIVVPLDRQAEYGEVARFARARGQRDGEARSRAPDAGVREGGSRRTGSWWTRGATGTARPSRRHTRCARSRARRSRRRARGRRSRAARSGRGRLHCGTWASESRQGRRTCGRSPASETQARTLKRMKVHLVDGTYELFRHFFADAVAEGRAGQEVGAVRGVRAVDSRDDRGRGDARRRRDRPRDRVVPQRPLCAGTRRARASRRSCWRSSRCSRKRCGRWASWCGRWWSSRRTTRWRRRRPSRRRTRASSRCSICTPDKDLAQCVVGTRVVQLDRRRDIVRDEEGVVAKWACGRSRSRIIWRWSGTARTVSGIAGLGREGRRGDVLSVPAFRGRAGRLAALGPLHPRREEAGRGLLWTAGRGGPVPIAGDPADGCADHRECRRAAVERAAAGVQAVVRAHRERTVCGCGPIPGGSRRM